jgi:hypothetical protein
MFCRANWKVSGLPGGDLLPGETREIEDEALAAHLVENGSISPVEPEQPAEPVEVEKCARCGAPRSKFKTPQAWGSHKKNCGPAAPPSE